jgi:hypothetical protein
MKTEMCKFFLANRCAKGTSCQFAHSASEIREKPELNRTSMCRDFLQTGTCQTPGCRFAHDERELRTTSAFFKTRLCRFASSGRCKHGSACRFAHESGELFYDSSRTSQPPPSEDGLETSQDWESNNSGSQHGDMAAGGDYQSNRGDLSSNQSTLAETSASVSTPDGSGDSGQEELRGGLAVPPGRCGARNRRQVGERHCTTIMMTNVPNFLTQGALVSLLEDLTQCMRGAFDFFYCPWDPCHDCNLGYAIVNFCTRTAAAEFERQWTNQFLFPKSPQSRRLRIVPAALQGRATNLRHFSGFSLAHHEDPRFRPLARASPNESLKPMAIVEELQQLPPPPELGEAGTMYSRSYGVGDIPMPGVGALPPFRMMMPQALPCVDGIVSGGGVSSAAAAWW